LASRSRSGRPVTRRLIAAGRGCPERSDAFSFEENDATGKLGKFRGTLSLNDIALEGSAITPHPAIAVNFRSFDTICGEPVRCTAEIADTVLQQGQGMHGSFSRADTWNFMAMQGPDFKSHFIELAPASNADLGRTIAQLLRLDIRDRGKLIGRVLCPLQPLQRHQHLYSC
jgi:hypothetical protein